MTYIGARHDERLRRKQQFHNGLWNILLATKRAALRLRSHSGPDNLNYNFNPDCEGQKQWAKLLGHFHSDLGEPVFGT